MHLISFSRKGHSGHGKDGRAQVDGKEMPMGVGDGSRCQAGAVGLIKKNEPPLLLCGHI